jgi:4-hydroxy-3-methylbut-2-en-1-yl diphosphate reductase
VRRLSGRCSHVYVLGAPHSSNSVRLVEVAQESGAQAQLIERADEIDSDWFVGARHLGLTSSASAPECLIADAITRLQFLIPTLAVREVGVPEQVVFKLPVSVIDLRRGADRLAHGAQVAAASF